MRWTKGTGEQVNGTGTGKGNRRGGGGVVQVGDNTVYSLKEGSLGSRRVL